MTSAALRRPTVGDPVKVLAVHADPSYQSSDGRRAGVTGQVRGTTLPEVRVQRNLDLMMHLSVKLLEAEVAFVSLVDERSQLWTSCAGMPTPIALLLSLPFSRQMARSHHALAIADGRVDPLFATMPAVRDGMVIAFAGTTLVATDGRAIGTFSVMDSKPIRWSISQLELLREMSVLVVGEVERDCQMRA